MEPASSTIIDFDLSEHELAQIQREANHLGLSVEAAIKESFLLQVRLYYEAMEES